MSMVPLKRDLVDQWFARAGVVLFIKMSVPTERNTSGTGRLACFRHRPARESRRESRRERD